MAVYMYTLMKTKVKKKKDSVSKHWFSINWNSHCFCTNSRNWVKLVIYYGRLRISACLQANLALNFATNLSAINGPWFSISGCWKKKILRGSLQILALTSYGNLQNSLFAFKWKKKAAGHLWRISQNKTFRSTKKVKMNFLLVRTHSWQIKWRQRRSEQLSISDIPLSNDRRRTKSPVSAAWRKSCSSLESCWLEGNERKEIQGEE